MRPSPSWDHQDNKIISVVAALLTACIKAPRGPATDEEGHWRKGKEIHPSTQRSTLIIYNTSTSSIKHTKEEDEAGKKNQCQHNEDGFSRFGRREKDKIFTSFGLFFAVATPVKPTKKKEGYRRTFHIISTKMELIKRTQTPKQCHNSTHLADPQLLPILARLFGSPACLSGRRSRGGGAGSAIYLHHRRGQRSPWLVQRKIGSSPEG